VEDINYEEKFQEIQNKLLSVEETLLDDILNGDNTEKRSLCVHSFLEFRQAMSVSQLGFIPEEEPEDAQDS